MSEESLREKVRDGILLTDGDTLDKKYLGMLSNKNGDGQITAVYTVFEDNNGQSYYCVQRFG